MPENTGEKNRPGLKIISDFLVDSIIEQAYAILKNTGIYIEDTDLLRFLSDQGLRVNMSAAKVMFEKDDIDTALNSAPSTIKLFDRECIEKACLEDNRVHFNPGSAAIKIYDGADHTLRRPTSADYINMVKLTQYMDNMDAQSTLLVPADVPEQFADRYRLYLSLVYCSKPVVTGIFAKDGLSVMVEMLKVIRGGSEQLRKFPLAIFDACPSPPLKWSKLTSHSLVQCAKEGIPTELISMPLAGATAPVTLAEALVQHTVENLSGVIISQVVQPGAPVIYGGSPAIFDMRYGTTPMGAVETVMIDCAYATIGKRLGLPTHAYLGLSDAKSPDFQAGSESTMGLLLGSLAGVNMISGPGMLDFESTQCQEKLILDNQTCGIARRLLRGIQVRETLQADELLKNIVPDFQFLSHPHTLKWFREEHLFPDGIIDREDAIQWETRGRKTAKDRAMARAEHILGKYDLPPLSEKKYQELTLLIRKNAEEYGIERLPS